MYGLNKTYFFWLVALSKYLHFLLGPSTILSETLFGAVGYFWSREALFDRFLPYLDSGCWQEREVSSPLWTQVTTQHLLLIPPSQPVLILEEKILDFLWIIVGLANQPYQAGCMSNILKSNYQNLQQCECILQTYLHFPAWECFCIICHSELLSWTIRCWLLRLS